MHRIQRKGLAAAAALACLLALGACGRSADEPVAQGRGVVPPSAGAPTVARREAVNASANADAAMDRAARSTRSMGGAAASPTRDLGAGAAAANVDDATITARVAAALAADRELSGLGMDVDTQNGVVTLSGPAPTAAAKERASEVARTVKGVTSVNNQLTLKIG